MLGRYRLEEAIGAGAFGTVWRARDERLDRVVAVKAIPAEFAGERAEREIRAAARLSHPGVVTLHEASSDSTHTYLVSEFVRGVTLQKLFAEGRASDRDVARIGAALAAALDHAHSHGVVHRDVKPGNVLIPDAPRSEAGIVKLADFGIARLAGDATLTVTGDVVGTLAYMSPEQAMGDEAGSESDLWSLAVVIHEGFSGKNPVRGRNPAETAQRLAAGDADLLSEVRPDLPEDLVDVIDAALEPDPFDRCSLQELGEALTEAVAQLDDEPGTVAPAVRRRERGFRGRRGSTQAVRVPFEDSSEIETEVAAFRGPQAVRSIDAPAWEPTIAAAEAPIGSFDQRPPAQSLTTESPILPWVRRLVGALAAGVTAGLWASQLAPAEVSHSIWPISIAVLCTVAVLPRIGWLAAVLAAVIAEVAAGSSGYALVLAAALLPSVALMWQAPHWWSLPTLAPLIGAPGFAGAWPGIASLAASVWLRAVAGAIGAWQICCAQLLLGRELLEQGSSITAGSAAWQSSAHDAVTLALVPMVDGKLPALAAIWAVAAATLPLFVAGRDPIIDAIAGAVWAAATATATITLAGGMTRGVISGALAGAALAVARRGLVGRDVPAVAVDSPPNIVLRFRLGK